MTEQRAQLEALSVSAGGLRDVTILTGDTEAIGHGFYIDEKSIDGAMKALLGKSVAAYLGHDGADKERLGQEMGFFSGVYREGMKLKARAFDFLESFRKSAGDLADKIMEIAGKHPDQLGLSPVISYAPFWVMADGSEKPARLGETAPAGAVRPIPSARIARVASVDFVRHPAANPDGLLSIKASLAPTVDAPTYNNTAAMSDSIKLEEHKAQLAKVETDVAAKLSAEHSAALAKKDEEHAAALSAVKAELETAKADYTAKLAAADLEHNKAVDALKAEHKAALEKAEALSAAKLGIPPLVLSAVEANLSALPAPEATDAGKWAQYADLSAKNPEQAKIFFRTYLRRG
jgi:hypothetical protein